MRKNEVPNAYRHLAMILQDKNWFCTCCSQTLPYRRHQECVSTIYASAKIAKIIIASPHSQNTELSSFPILPNQSFSSNYSEKIGIKLEFKTMKG